MNRVTGVSLRALQTTLSFLLLAVVVVPNAKADYQVGPLFPPHADYDYAPSMIREGNIDKFWWCGNNIPGSGSNDVIYYRSVDRTTLVWSPILKVLTPSATGWDSWHTCDPSVIKGSFLNPENGQTYIYAMYYTGVTSTEKNAGVGLAFSNNGVNWIKYSNSQQPIIPPQNPFSNTYGAGQPATVNTNGIAAITLFHTDTSTSAGERAYVRTSSNGINFSNPILVSNAVNGGSVGVNGDYGYDSQTDTFYGVFGSRQRLFGPGNEDNDREALGVGIHSIPGSQLLAGQGTWTLLGEIDTNLTGSYLNHNPGFLRDGFGNVTPWLPAIAVYFSRGTNTEATWELSWTIWDNQPSTLALSRWYSSSVNEIRDVTGYVGPGYTFYGTLGYVYMGFQPNTHPMYACSISNEHFASLDPNCEGQFQLGLFGFLHTSQPPGIPTAPLFRCRAIYDHFLSLHNNCEGWTMEGLMGYIRTQQ